MVRHFGGKVGRPEPVSLDRELGYDGKGPHSGTRPVGSWVDTMSPLGLQIFLPLPTPTYNIRNLAKVLRRGGSLDATITLPHLSLAICAT